MFNFFHSKLNTNYIKIAKQRVYFSIFMIFFIFLCICFRLFQVMIYENYLFKKSLNNNIPITYSRADILDRNNELIATSVPTESVYAVPEHVQDKPQAIKKLKEAFPELNENYLKSKLNGNRKFVWIKRHLTPMQVERLLSLGITGIYFLKTQRRVYPDKNLFSHVLGYTDIDNNGLAGIEKKYDEQLKMRSKPLKLTIDSRIQNAVHEELCENMQKFSAKGAGCIVMDIKNGEVISLVSIPDFDPHTVVNPNDKKMFNLLTSSAIEPGSNAKIINTAIAFDIAKFSPEKEFDARNPIRIGKFSIKDFHGKKTFLSIKDIFKYSSNIGSAKMIMEIGHQKQKQFFKKIGLLSCFDFDLELQHPLLPKNWTEVSAITISYGHGIAFCPIHYITALAGIVNDGVTIKPHLLLDNYDYEKSKNDDLNAKNDENFSDIKNDSENKENNFKENTSKENNQIDNINKKNQDEMQNIINKDEINQNNINQINQDSISKKNEYNDKNLQNPPPTLQEKAKIVTKSTSKKIKALMRINVIEGTNRKANVPGYMVGGKSGTAEKNAFGQYNRHANYTSFFGVFPMDDPQYIVYVILDEPQKTAQTYGFASAGWNAVPTAGGIIQKIAMILGIKPNNAEEKDWADDLK